MHYTYILISQIDPKKHYVGITNNISRRFKEHNEMPTNCYTKKYGPWVLKTYIAVEELKIAEQLEKYFKSHNGKAFLKKRLI